MIILWLQNFCTTLYDELTDNMKLTISHCKSQDLDRFDKNPQKVSWSEELSSALKKLHKPIKFDKNKIRIALFRPFIKQFLYFDPVFITAKYKIPLFYSSNSTDNPSIIVPDKTKSEFSTMISETSPDLQVIANGQCFPLYAKIHKGSKLDLGLQSSNPPILQSSNPPILQYRDSGARQNQGRVLGIHHRHNTGSAHIGNQSGVSIQGNVGGGGGGREKNLAIITPDKIKGEFSVFITNLIPDLEVVHHGQVFPMKVKE